MSDQPGGFTGEGAMEGLERTPGQILAGERGRKETKEKDLELVSDDEDSNREDEEEKDYPVIRLTKEEKAQLRELWKQTLIVKVLGKKVGFTYQQKWLNIMWRPKARIELVTLENDYFLVKFLAIDDYEFAKFRGPWMVLNHNLIVKEWMPNFDPFTDSTEKVIVWVRFPCLLVEYYDYKFLMKVAGKIGMPITIDTATSLVSRARFARVCVDVDITKPLLSKFKLRRRVRCIWYEELHMICFHCGMYGYNESACGQTKTAVPGDTDTSGDGTSKLIVRDETPNGNIGAMQERKSYSHTKDLIRPEVVDNYGAWMIVSRERRRPNRATDKRDQRVNKTGKPPAKNKLNEEMMGSGSRFKALDEEVVEGHDVTGERLVMNQEETNQNRTNVNSGYSKGNNGNKGNKGKRPAVQANEKQISGNNLHGRHKVQSAQSEAGTSGGERREMIRNKGSG
ncbi:uncharacterized protein LOC116010917 [Ipomoea triloba]|uniref:uncharacterized protein LOC116010917 n=1 Tax=Ipomoea triloba TaxID=35885 RepID=UPI00125D4EF4|nr:uncharacterized protein LOC116010917 [Ipomoea triloba]